MVRTLVLGVHGALPWLRSVQLWEVWLTRLAVAVVLGELLWRLGGSLCRLLTWLLALAALGALAAAVPWTDWAGTVRESVGRAWEEAQTHQELR